jgi:subtilisin-like proprotein convertase family protein
LVLPAPGFSITSLAVRVDHLSHTYDSDLQISLIAPTGLKILVTDQVGVDGDNFLGTILSDAGSLPIVDGAAPFTGNFRPDNPLFQVNHLNSAGTWKLHVVDLFGGDTGSLNAWALEVCR